MLLREEFEKWYYIENPKGKHKLSNWTSFIVSLLLLVFEFFVTILYDLDLQSNDYLYLFILFPLITLLSSVVNIIDGIIIRIKENETLNNKYGTIPINKTNWLVVAPTYLALIFSIVFLLSFYSKVKWMAIIFLSLNLICNTILLYYKTISEIFEVTPK